MKQWYTHILLNFSTCMFCVMYPGIIFQGCCTGNGAANIVIAPAAVHKTLTSMHKIVWHYSDVIMSLKSPASREFTRPFRRRSRKTPKLRVTGLCQRNSPVTGFFPAHPSNAQNVSICLRHHAVPNHRATKHWWTLSTNRNIFHKQNRTYLILFWMKKTPSSR